MNTTLTKTSLARSLIASSPNDVRIGPVLSVPDILTQFGIRPERAFSMASIDPALFRDPDSRVALPKIGRLLEVCVTLTGCNHFGLLLGERFDLTGFGPLGDLMRNSATVGDALRSLLMHLHLHDRGAAPVLLSPCSSYMILGYSIYHHSTPATAQIYDAAIAIAYRILHELCSSSWKPLRVQFSYSPPNNTLPYRQLFRSKISFNAEVSGIVFESALLNQPIKGADPVLHEHLLKTIQAAENSHSMSFSEKVQYVLPQMVLSGSVSASAVANLFGISERTLRRRLKEQGSNLQQLLNEARFELARQLLHHTNLAVSEVAVALRYADPNIFSRAFRSWAGLSPMQWRARQLDDNHNTE